MALSDMANDPFALSPGALRHQKLSLTHSDGVNGPADITGQPSPSIACRPPQHCHVAPSTPGNDPEGPLVTGV